MDSGTLLPRTSRRVVKLEKPSPLKRNQSTADIESAAPHFQSDNGGNKGFHRSLSLNDAVTTKQHLENGSTKAENVFARKASRHQLKLEKPATRLNSCVSADTKAIHGVNRRQLVTQLSQDSGLGDASFLLPDSARNSLTEQPADIFTIPVTKSRKPSQDEGMFEDSQAILGDSRSENSGEHKYQYDMKVWGSNKFGDNESCHGNRKNVVICDDNNNENCSNSNNYNYHSEHENGNHSLEKSPDDLDPEITPTNKANLAAWLTKSRTLCKQSSGTGFNPAVDDAFLTYRDKRNDSNDLSSSTSASTCAVTDDEHSEHLNACELVDELADDMFSCKLSEPKPKHVRRLTIPGYRDETYAYDYPDDLDEIDAELDFGRDDELPSSQESYDMVQLKAQGKFKNSVLKSSSPVLIPDEKIVVVLRQPLAPTSSLDEIWAVEETMKGGLYTAKGRRAMFRNFKMCDVEEIFPEIFRQYSAEQLLEIGSSPAAGLPPSDWLEICGVYPNICFPVVAQLFDCVKYLEERDYIMNYNGYCRDNYNTSTPWKGPGLLPTPTSWAQQGYKEGSYSSSHYQHYGASLALRDQQGYQEGPYSSSHFQHFGTSSALRDQQSFKARPNPSLQEFGASLESQVHVRAFTSRWDQHSAQHQREVTTQPVRQGFGMPRKLLDKEQISIPLEKSEGSSLAEFTHDQQSSGEQNTPSICNNVQKSQLAKEESLLSCDTVVTANLDEKCDVTVNGGSITSQFNQHRPSGRGRGRKKTASPGVKLFASATQEIVTNKIQYTRSVSDPGYSDFGTVAFSADRSVQNQGPNTESEISQYSSDNSRRLRHFSESCSTGIGVKNYKIHHSYTDDDEPNEAPLNKDFVPRKCPW